MITPTYLYSLSVAGKDNNFFLTYQISIEELIDEHRMNACFSVQLHEWNHNFIEIIHVLGIPDIKCIVNLIPLVDLSWYSSIDYQYQTVLHFLNQ